MKILVYGIHYHPDLIGIPKYSGEMCEWLAAQGHDVSMITGKPFYPEWEVKSEYGKKGWFTEKLKGVTVHRCPLYVPKKPSAGKKIIHEALFVISSLWYWFKALFSRHDVIITVCPPFHIGIISGFFSWLKRTPHIYHVQDLQVDIANDLEMIKNKKLLDFLFFLEKGIMKNATVVSTISDGMKNKIRNKGIDEKQLYFFPNWVDSKFIYPLPKEESLKTEFGFKPTDKIVLYSGNLGEKQGLEHVVEAADALRDHTDIKFIIVGSGAGKKKIQELAITKQLQDKIYFFPLQPYEKLPALLATGDLHLVLQKKNASDLILPSKLTSILAAGGCPIVTASEGTTLFDTITKNQIGFAIEPENTNALKSAILKGLMTENETIKSNARDFSMKYLDKENILKNLEQFMAKISNKNIANKSESTSNKREITT